MMLKAFAVLVWPIGIAAILIATAFLARRPSRRTAPAAALNGHNGSDGAVASRSARSSIIGMLLILAVGAVAVFALTCLLGTFPSGGCDRILVLYGLIAYLIWREVSGTRRTAIWSAGAVAALAFNEAYSRQYLTLHWTTDILSGLVYGGLILAVFIATIRLVVGPARQTGTRVASHLAPVSGQHAPTLQ